MLLVMTAVAGSGTIGAAELGVGEEIDVATGATTVDAVDDVDDAIVVTVRFRFAAAPTLAAATVD